MQTVFNCFCCFVQKHTQGSVYRMLKKEVEDHGEKAAVSLYRALFKADDAEATRYVAKLVEVGGWVS